MNTLAAVRRRYAARMMELAHVADARLEEAFAQVPREDFAGTPPWTLHAERDKALGGDDPATLYADVLVALDPRKGINNGSPSLHALMLHRLGVRPGQRVLHAGIGAGYYTAILSRLVGPEGQVVAMEFDPKLAEIARGNLAGCGNVTVLQGDAALPPAEMFDRIYVNFACARPAAAWLDVLAEGGNLVFPLGVSRPGRRMQHSERGAVLRVSRIGGGYAVRFVSHCAFVLAEGALADAPARNRLHAAFARGGVEFVQSLRRGAGPVPPSPERAWFWSPTWSLSYDPPPP